MELTGKHCLLTGGAGFIGSHLVDELMNADRKVRVLDNLANGKLENMSNHLGQENFQFFRGSIPNLLDVQRADECLTKTIDFFRNHPLGIKGLMKSETGRNWEEVYD
jgi:UDP-glucose 4-epimerase